MKPVHHVGQGMSLALVSKAVQSVTTLPPPPLSGLLLWRAPHLTDSEPLPRGLQEEKT